MRFADIVFIDVMMFIDIMDVAELQYKLIMKAPNSSKKGKI